MGSCFLLPRHRPQVRGPRRHSNPHYLRPSGCHVCPCCAGGLPVGAAAGLRGATGPQHRGHPPQQQHTRHGLGQASRNRHPGHPYRPNALVRPLQPPALCPVCALLHPRHPLHHQHGSASAHAANGLPHGETVQESMLCQDPAENGQAQPPHGTFLCFRDHSGTSWQLAITVIY